MPKEVKENFRFFIYENPKKYFSNKNIFFSKISSKEKFDPKNKDVQIIFKNRRMQIKK